MFGKLCCGGLRTVFKGVKTVSPSTRYGFVRTAHNKASSVRTRYTLYYLGAVGVLVVGASYGGIHEGPLPNEENQGEKNHNQVQCSSSLMWNFRPEQAEIIVTPGETALAFYRAENKTSKPVDGISTYNVINFDAGQYFNKIQCFCFQEQRLNPGETVELPVFFYIDPEFSQDPRMEHVDLITLSYTLFASKEMGSIPNFVSAHGKR